MSGGSAPVRETAPAVGPSRPRWRAATGSALYVGWIRHRRSRPVRNEFRYGCYQVLLDLDELPRLAASIPFLGHNRHNLTSFHDADHLGAGRGPVRAKLERWLARRGVELGDARVLLLTNLRVLGYVFNPVSYFYVLEPGGGLRCVVAEVHNTWGEVHPYLLDELEPVGASLVGRVDKVLHVSPFVETDEVAYRWRFTPPGRRLVVHVDESQRGERFLDATLSLERRPLTARTLAGALLRYPHMTARTIFLIHWQALKLWWKGTPVTHKPDPPDAGLETSTDPVAEAAREPGRLDRFARGALERALEGLAGGRLTIVAPDGTRSKFGDPDPGPGAPRPTLTVADWAFYRRVLLEGGTGAGAAYIDGLWSADDLVGLIRLVASSELRLESAIPFARLGTLAHRIAHFRRRNTRRGAARNVVDHYDLGNDFYRLWLDDTLGYSCALFDDPETTLADAQRAKFRSIADKARLEPGDRVLEIGCGWGGFAAIAAGEYGARVTGITLSPSQAQLARERLAAAGLADRTAIEIVDYRDVEGTFDKVVSIEMLEGVGEGYLGEFMASIDRILGPDGIAVVQVISMPDPRYPAYRKAIDYTQRYIFPGSHLPSLGALTDALDGTRLMIESAENIGVHYAETLRRWRVRFLEQADAVRALGHDDAFLRRWEFYLAFCEAGFLTRQLADYQLVLTRTGNRRLPRGPHPAAG